MRRCSVPMVFFTTEGIARYFSEIVEPVEQLHGCMFRLGIIEEEGDDAPRGGGDGE